MGSDCFPLARKRLASKKVRVSNGKVAAGETAQRSRVPTAARSLRAECCGHHAVVRLRERPCLKKERDMMCRSEGHVLMLTFVPHVPIMGEYTNTPGSAWLGPGLFIAEVSPEVLVLTCRPWRSN